MKKSTICLLSVLLAVLVLLTGCGGSGDETETLKLGLGVYTEASANGSITSTAAAVLLDEEGKFAGVRLDTVETSASVDTATGAVSCTDTTSKYDKGDGYNMGDISPIGKEWYEQADAFAAYCVGKTPDQIASLALEDGRPTDTDLSAGCTIGVTGFQQAIARACQTAKVCGASSSDKLVLSIVTDTSGSKAVTLTDGAYAVGKFVSASEFCALTVDASGKATAAFFDTTESSVTVDITDGAAKFTVLAQENYVSKYERGDAYNMGEISPIGKEWYEQADAFSAYCVGKTASQVASTAVEDGKATDTDLSAGCTISVTGFLGSAQAAFAKAK